MATIRTDIDPSTRNTRSEYSVFSEGRGEQPVKPRPATDIGQPAAKAHDLGRQLDEYDAKIQRLQTELMNATTEKHGLVDAFRSLHDQFDSLQLHADRQCEVLLSGGEELRATRQSLASLQKEIASTREEYERSKADSSKQDEADYRDALHGMEQELRDYKAAAVEQEKDNAELVLKIESLERRCLELDDRYAERENTGAELRHNLDDRSRQIERLNRYVIRMRRELTILDDKIRTAKRSIKPRNGKPAGTDEEVAAFAKPPEKHKTSSGGTVTLLRPAIRQNQEPWLTAGDRGQMAFEDVFMPQQFIIVPIGDEVSGPQYPLNKNELMIGRNRDHDIPVHDRSASRDHARIVLRGFKVFIEDMGSKYGLLVNSEPKERQELKHGDKFTIGRKEFELVDLAVRASGLRTSPAA